MKIQKPVYYGDYLQLPKILGAQKTESEKYGTPAHDETLFIIIHQTYELWFKQILHELNSIKEVFQQPFLPSSSLFTIHGRLIRVTEIQKILIQQIDVMETMSTVDFMEFRDFLVPASGFQSLQFRMIEATLGIKPEHRMEIEKKFFTSRLKEEDRNRLSQIEQEVSILECLEKWLSRMPFGKHDQYDFWQDYSLAVTKMFESDREIISQNPILDESTRNLELKNLEASKKNFDKLLDLEKYLEWKKQGQVRLSHTAMLSAVFISLYRKFPALQMPYQILNKLVEVDENFTTWRYRHALMVQRILGTKIGTGGSSGHEYLKSTTERNRAFIDFFHLASFLLPKEITPDLPYELKKQLDFVYDSNHL